MNENVVKLENNFNQTIERKIAVIFVTDVVGFSKSMEHNEDETLRSFRTCKDILDKLFTEHGGRIFNTAGDSFMVEFNSTFKAVNAAIKIQKELHQINSKFELKDKLEFRMGVNLGDVIIDGTNLLGDGVNVAARLESIAPPGGICLSEIVYNLVKSKVSEGFIKKGKQKLKNIKEEITCYYVDIKTGSVDPKTFKPISSSGASKSIISVVAASLIGVVLATSYYLFNKEKEFAKYNTDSSAAPAANFGIFWVTAFFIVGLYILFTGPEGTWPFFIINVIVFAMATVYNFCFHFKIAFQYGRDKVTSTIEQPVVSIVVLAINLVIVYGLSDKIYL